MAEKAEKDHKLHSNISGDSVRVVSEAIGITGLPEAAASYLADDCTYRLKQTIQEAIKFMQHGKRRKLTCADFDNALRVQNVEFTEDSIKEWTGMDFASSTRAAENRTRWKGIVANSSMVPRRPSRPLYGFHTPDLVPFRYASGGGRELHFTEDKELDLQEVINSSLPKVPLDLGLKAHWLSIDGLQPAIPENPPPATKDQQKLEILDTSVKAAIDKNQKPVKPGETISKLKHKKKVADVVKMKDLSTHELSVEQQLYYKEITEACVGSDEGKRSEALQSLATDPGLHQMLPRFTTFIFEGVKINVVQNNLALLIYLMRMMKALMDNQTLYLEKYLHEFIPAVTTCIVSKQLCMRPDVDNHWALRDFAARLNAQICKNFSTNTNNIQARITKTFSKAIRSEKAALATQYGAMSGLGELGSEVIISFVLPHLKALGDRVQSALEGLVVNNADKIAADNIRKIVCKYVSPVLKSLRNPTDTVEEYISHYGYFGQLLFEGVQKERQQVALSQQIQAQQRPTVQIPQNKIVIQQPGGIGSIPGTPTSARFQGGIISVPRTPTTPNAPTPGQKIVIVSQQRPNTPVGQSITVNTGSSSTGNIVKVPPGPSSQPGIQTVSTSLLSGSTSPAQKVVVMSLPSSSSGSQPPSQSELGMRSIFSEQAQQGQPHVSILKQEPDG